MKIQFILLTILVGFLVTCDDDPQADVRDASIEISIKSEDGTDLLDPKNPNAFDESQILIYHLVDGNFEVVNEPNLDSPKGFLIYAHPDSTFRISIWGNIIDNNELGTSLVKWNDSDTDTLKYEIKRYANGATVVISKVWFNDVEVWDESSKTERYFEIIK